MAPLVILNFIISAASVPNPQILIFDLSDDVSKLVYYLWMEQVAAVTASRADRTCCPSLVPVRAIPAPCLLVFTTIHLQNTYASPSTRRHTIHECIYPSVCPSVLIHPCLPIKPSVQPSIYLTIHLQPLSVHLSIHSYPSVLSSFSFTSLECIQKTNSMKNEGFISVAMHIFISKLAVHIAV